MLILFILFQNNFMHENMHVAYAQTFFFIDILLFYSTVFIFIRDPGIESDTLYQ